MPAPWQVEASSAYKGIGIVKLMGRQSGFITVSVRQQWVRAEQATWELLPFRCTSSGPEAHPESSPSLLTR